MSNVGNIKVEDTRDMAIIVAELTIKGVGFEVIEKFSTGTGKRDHWEIVLTGAY